MTSCYVISASAAKCALLGYYAVSIGNSLPLGQPIGPIVKGQESWPLKMRPTGLPEMSIEIATTRCVIARYCAVLENLLWL
jgi:hypothetical protein